MCGVVNVEFIHQQTWLKHWSEDLRLAHNKIIYLVKVQICTVQKNKSRAADPLNMACVITVLYLVSQKIMIRNIHAWNRSGSHSSCSYRTEDDHSMRDKSQQQQQHVYFDFGCSSFHSQRRGCFQSKIYARKRPHYHNSLFCIVRPLSWIYVFYLSGQHS